MFTPPIPILLPFAVALMLAIWARAPRFLASLISLLTVTAVLFASVALAVFARDATYIVWSRFGLSLVIDASSAMLCIVASILMFASIMFSYRYCSHARGTYHALALTLLGGICGFSESGNLGNMALFFAIMGAAAFGLCRHDPEHPALPGGTRRFGVAMGSGLLCLLVAVAMVLGRTGSLNMAEASRTLGAQADPIVAAALGFSLCGFFLLAGIVPFHFWVSDAHAIAPAPVCALLSGILMELGIYGAARVYWVLFSGALSPWQNDIRNGLVVWGAVAAVVGSIMAFRQRNLKRLLAYSTVSEMGILLMAVALLAPSGLAGAAIALVGHGFLKAALFLASGIVLHRMGSVDEVHLHGRGRHLRWTGTLFFVSAAGLAGLPPFGVFWGNVLMHGTAFGLGFGWVPWVAIASSVLSAAAIFRFAGGVFFAWGALPPEEGEAARRRWSTPPSLYIAATLLVFCGLLAGLIPGLTGSAYADAIRIQDRTGYQQRVIDLLVPYPPTVHDQPASGADVAAAIAAVLAAGLLAGAGGRLHFRLTPRRHAPSLR